MQTKRNKSINIRIENLLNSMEQLEDNWDEDDAIIPDSSCLKFAKDIVSRMDKLGQYIYQIAPGPNGEVMLDFRKGDKKMLCLTFHPRMRTFATVFRTGSIDDNEYTNGDFTMEKLPELLDWLNK